MQEEEGGRRRAPVPILTYSFLALCVLVTVPSIFIPSLYSYLGGTKPLTSNWQLLTLPFQHGFHGFPAILHLGLDALLLLYCGVFAERLLGRTRFALLTLAAMAAFAVAHQCPVVEGHGSSGVIWAYAPIVLVALRHERRKLRDGKRLHPYLELGEMVLVLMWGIITVIMTVLVYSLGYRGNPVFALLLGNIFHVSATLVGAALAYTWRDRIRGRLDEAIPAW